MVNFVVVDDNKFHRNKVTNIILSYMMNNKLDFKINEFSDYDEKLLNYIKSNNNQSIFILDLELPNGDGIDIAKIVRNKNNDWISPIIILTVHTSLYYEVYKQRLQILDFIGKCESVEKNLTENIDICMKVLNINKTYRFSYKNIDYSIPLLDINSIQRDGRKTKIITTNNVYYLNKSIVEIKEELPKYFVISSKGTIINTKNVKEVDWVNCKVYFKNGTSDFIVSKNHKKELNNCEFG